VTTPESTARVPDVLSSGHAFLECPRWHDGRLYASDFFKHEVLAWDGEGRPHKVVDVPAQPSGLGWDLDGRLLVVSMVDRRLMRLEGDSLVEVADLSALATWHCNDLVVDSVGGAYIGNFGWDESVDPVIVPTALHRVDASGEVCVVAEDLICPNGMAISPDGATLLVNESFAARITAFDRAGDGSLSNRRVWASFSDTEFATVPEALAAEVLLPDGMSGFDAEGAIWTADCRGQGVTRIAEGGAILDHVSTAPQATFSVALGGEDGRTLFMVTTFPYGAGDPSVQHESTMRRVRVDVPIAE
jgi:YD repeat-containing protein